MGYAKGLLPKNDKLPKPEGDSSRLGVGSVEISAESNFEYSMTLFNSE